MATDARHGLERLLEGGDEIRLRRDRTDRDEYGRLLRYAYVDGDFVNETLVAGGLALARSYPPDTAEDARLARAGERARRAGRGLWAEDACGGRPRPGLRISALRADPPGPDLDRLGDEWVEIENAETSPITLTGFVLRDESASHRFRFPQGFRLDGGDSVRVRTGCGKDDDVNLHWCRRGSAVWNNDGDTAYLLDPRGAIVARRTYGRG